MSKKNIIVWTISTLIVILVIVGFFVIINITKKRVSEKAEIVNLNKTKQEEPKSVMERLSPELKEKIKKEQAKVLALNGTIEKIEARILSVKVGNGELKDKIYQVTLVPEAKIMLTKIDSETGAPTISELSLEKIKIGDEIIAWSKEDLRDKMEFESEYLEVIER